MDNAAALLAGNTEQFIAFPNLGIRLNNLSKYFKIGNFEIHWYGVIICTGLILCMVLAMLRSKSYGIKRDDLLDYILAGIPISIVCARIYYVIFSWGYYSKHPGDIFKIWNGGIAIYGSVIGMVLVALIGTKIKKRSFLHLLDFAMPYIILGQAIGRWGNFINQEAYGSQTNWLFAMTGSEIEGSVHPTFLYESVWCFIGFAFMVIYRKKLQKYIGEVTALYMMIYGFERAIVEGLRTDSLMIGSHFRVSQWLSVVIVGAGVALFIVAKKRKKSLAEVIELFEKEMRGEIPAPGKAEKAPKKPAKEKVRERSSLSDVADLLAEHEAEDSEEDETGEEASEEADEDDSEEDVSGEEASEKEIDG